MRVVRADNYEDMSVKAAEIIAAEVVLKPNAVLGLATGSSPIGVYENLVRKCREGKVDFSRVKTVNLDEYCGLDISSDQSYVWFMHHHLFDQINIDPANTHFPDGKEADADKACREYDKVMLDTGDRKSVV